MAKKTTEIKNTECPETLANHIFFGLRLDKEQKKFRDAIWSQDKDIIFCNAKAGTGKTTIAVATAKLLVEYKRYEKAYYIISPVMNDKNGFLPGGVVDKESPYYAPLFDALVKVGDFPEKALSPKEGFWITPMSHVYTRGINFEKSIVIIDESQNFDIDELKRVITRVVDNCKVVVIGHTGQIDLKHKDASGFARYLEHFKEKERSQVCELIKNYRGWISSWADELGN